LPFAALVAAPAGPGTAVRAKRRSLATLTCRARGGSGLAFPGWGVHLVWSGRL